MIVWVRMMQHWLIWTNKSYETLNTLRPRQNGRHFTDNIFKCILLNETVWISIITSLKFAPKSQVDNIPTVVQIMAWWQPGNKPLSEPMMVSGPTRDAYAWQIGPFWQDTLKIWNVTLDTNPSNPNINLCTAYFPQKIFPSLKCLKWINPYWLNMTFWYFAYDCS